MSKRLSLQFRPGDPSGFTGMTTAMFNDVSPARILREILQNSLDAAVEAGEKTAIVRFEISFLEHGDLPDLRGYEQAFRAAVKYHEKDNGGRLPDPAQQVVETVRGAIAEVKAGRHYMLSVLDNGVGFDERRLTAVLGDGSGSHQQEGSAGSYGVGHFSAVSASDLHYMLYGGVSKTGKRIASGFAILAGRPGRPHPLSARGFLVKKLLDGTKSKLFSFATGREVPSIIRKALDRIERDWHQGSAVMIPAFNYFGDDSKWLADIITRVAAFNFSVAIHAGELVVEVDEEQLEGGTLTKVDRGNLSNILEEEGQRRHAFRSDTWYRGLRPAGQDALGAYLAVSRGSRVIVSTVVGQADLRILTPAPTGRTRLDLFRNGMWITESIPGLSPNTFADLETFHAVLIPVHRSELHRLIRKAEGAMHNQLSLKLLNDVERERLQTACRAIEARIKTEVPKRATEGTYTPDDFLVVSSGGDGGAGGTGSYAMWGHPVVVQSARLTQVRTGGTTGEETKIDREGKGRAGVKTKRNRRDATRRRSRPLPFRSTAVPDGRGRYNIEIECQEALEEVLLKFRVDENTDATCDRLWPDEEIVLRSFRATGRDGTELPGELEDGNTTIRLRGLAADAYNVVIEYEAPAGFDDAVQAPVFRVDLHKPQPD